MNKFILTMVGTLLSGTQVAAAQGRMGVFGGLRTAYPRVLAKVQAQKLATMELDRASAESLRQLSIVMHGMPVSPAHFGRALPPLRQARVMLYEREALLEVLRRSSRDEVSVPLRKMVKLANNGTIELKHDNDTEQVSLDQYNLSDAVDFYVEIVLELAAEEAFVIAGSKDPLALIRLGRLLEEQGRRSESLLSRVKERQKTGRRDITRTLQELSQAGDDPYPTALVRTIAENIGFSVQIEALAEPIVDDWGEMALPGIETKAMIYEFAARLAATHADGETLQANLRRILALNNDIDRVIMTVAVRGRKVVLSEASFFAVQQLYLHVFAPTASTSHYEVLGASKYLLELPNMLQYVF